MTLPNETSTKRGVIAVIRKEEKYLVIRRSLTESAPGKICFPGGGVDAGETDTVALTREVIEEVGIEGAVAVRCIWESETPSGIQLTWWETKIPADAIPVPNPVEASEFFWWSEEEMRNCEDLLPTNLAFLNAAIESA